MKMNNNPIRELELQKICTNFFLRKGLLAREEVPFLLKVADIFSFNQESGECIAVEVKIRDWRRALKQALVYQLVADKVYIALLDEHIPAVVHDSLLEHSIGLISINTDGTVRIVLEASVSNKRLPYLTSQAVATAFPDHR